VGQPPVTVSTGSSGGTAGAGESTTDAGAPDTNNYDHDAGHTGEHGDAGTVDAADAVPVPAVCTANRADCNGISADGCEVDLSSSAAHCGFCATACGTAGTSSVQCVSGACELHCAPNHIDCDGDPKNGCEMDMSTDVNNCGACGHDCQGGACQAGQCQPTAVLVGLSSPRLLAPVGDTVSLVRDDSIEPYGRLIHVHSPTNNSEAIFDRAPPVAVDGNADWVYWAIPSTAASGDPPNGEIDRYEEGTAIRAAVLRDGIDPRGLAVDGKNIYWSDFTSNGIFQQSLGSDRTVTQLTTTATPALSLVSDGTTLFAANSNGNTLFSIPVGGGALSQLTGIPGKSTASSYVAVDAKYAYAWFYDTFGVLHLEQLTKPNFTNPREITSGTVSSIRTPLAVDANHVYFVKDQGLYGAPTNTTGAPSLIQNAVGTISGVAVSNGVLYWLDTGSSATDGRLYRLVL
jgi:hypothetical protein